MEDRYLFKAKPESGSLFPTSDSIEWSDLPRQPWSVRGWFCLHKKGIPKWFREWGPWLLQQLFEYFVRGVP